jgi:hypothetical protein
MPVGSFKVYGAAAEAIAKNTVDLDSNTFRMVLVTSGYTPNQNTHSTWADASANEASGTGYTSSGKLLTCTVNRTNLVVTFDCDDQTWTTATITAKYAIIVKDADANGTIASTDALLAYCDLETGGGSVSSTASSFAITINASGVFTITAS